MLTLLQQVKTTALGVIAAGTIYLNEVGVNVPQDRKQVAAAIIALAIAGLGYSAQDRPTPAK